MSAEFNIDFGQAYDLPKVTVPDVVRVKFLDREDIESLGFTYKEKDRFDLDSYEEFSIPRKNEVDVSMTWYFKENLLSIEVRVQGFID